FAKLLLEYGADINATVNGTDTALTIAISNHDREIAELLIERMEDQALYQHGGPLDRICMSGLPEETKVALVSVIIERVKKAGLFSDLIEKMNKPAVNSPLTYAVMHRNLNLIKLLLENGADPMAKECNGETALDEAAN